VNEYSIRFLVPILQKSSLTDDGRKLNRKRRRPSDHCDVYISVEAPVLLSLRGEEQVSGRTRQEYRFNDRYTFK